MIIFKGVVLLFGMPGNSGEVIIDDANISDSNTQRVILHCDLNNFYASVECLHHPELNGLPVAVGGSEKNRHGIILAKNQLAKSFGVKTAEPIWQAKSKCPNLVIVPPHMDEYVRYSCLVRNIYERFTDCIEPFGIDECWLDITGSTMLLGSGEKIADTIRKTIREELGLSVSVGVSWNKIFAKLGSDMKKPDATTVITKDNYRNSVWTLPVEDLLFVGRKTSGSLKKIGITTIGRLAQSDKNFLTKRFGKWGTTVWAYANGFDLSPVEKDWAEIKAKGIGNSTTLPHDIYTYSEAKKVLFNLADSVSTRLREGKLKGRTICIFLRTNDLESFDRQMSIENLTNISTEISRYAMLLLEKNWHPGKDKPLRALGIRVTGLEDECTPVQMSLFDNSSNSEKNEKLEKTMDNIRKKYGDDSVTRALLMDE